jgi:hypothetical protein
MAKTAPNPPCTVTALWLKYQYSARMAAPATFNKFSAIKFYMEYPQIIINPKSSHMNKKLRNEKILFYVSEFLLLSIILMITVMPMILNDSSPGADPKQAAIAILAAIIIHLLIFVVYVKFIRESRRSNKNRKGEYIGLGVLLIFFGLIYMDGAFAFLSHENMLLGSILMFISVLCNFAASTMTITLFFLKPQKVI